MVVGDKDKPESIKTAAFTFDQETPKNAEVMKHLTSIDEIEAISGLDYFSELPDDVENRIEEKDSEEWAKKQF